MMYNQDLMGPQKSRNALQAFAENELMLIYLFCRWSGVTDVGYKPHGMGKKGPAFALPTRQEVDYALKFMK